MTWDLAINVLILTACNTFWFWYLMTTKARLTADIEKRSTEK